MFERKKQAGKIYFLPIDQIRPSPFQARREFSEQELAALAQSIRENGLLQPISVRKVSDGGYVRDIFLQRPSKDIDVPPCKNEHHPGHPL